MQDNHHHGGMGSNHQVSGTTSFFSVQVFVQQLKGTLFNINTIQILDNQIKF
ncbi:hypothetical protein Hanom_Chr12g01098861 [Helianthus anomalus]